MMCLIVIETLADDRVPVVKRATMPCEESWVINAIGLFLDAIHESLLFVRRTLSKAELHVLIHSRDAIFKRGFVYHAVYVHDIINLHDTVDGIASPRKRMRQEEVKENSHVVEGCLLDTSETDFVPGSLDMSNIKILPHPDDASRTASSQLLKAFNALLRTQITTPAHELGWYINPNGVVNMYQWIVELHSFDKDIPLAQDMKKAEITSIVLEMRFTNQYPFAPPFVRVVKPRFLPFNQGGGGHITEGGAICMELLTNSGWSAVSSIESVLLQIRLAMSENERPARLATKGGHGNSRGVEHGVYGVGEAIVAFERACRAHGWTVPPAFSSLHQSDGGASRRV